MKPIDLMPLYHKGVRPRVHGNGFLQLELEGNDVRLHVWGHPLLPRQKIDTGIHNHTWGFKSLVIVGQIVQVSYQVEGVGPSVGTRFKRYKPIVREGEDTILQDTGERVSALRLHTQIVDKGHTYMMNAGDYHETLVTVPAATLMTKSYKSPTLEHASVLVPLHSEPDNDFNRNSFDDEQLWQIIADVCGDSVLLPGR